MAESDVKSTPASISHEVDEVAAKEGEKVSKAYSEAGKRAASGNTAQDKTAQAESDLHTSVAETIQKQVEAATEEVTVEPDDSPSKVTFRKNKFTEDGRVIGLDGENPVSNENPDPLAVQETRFL